MNGHNREEWLRSAYEALKAELLPEAPGEAAICWGFPSKGALARRTRIGECWTSGFTQVVEGKTLVLVSPTVQKPVDILSVLLHEMIHGATPGKGHRKEFSQLAKRCGLRKPWTATTPGPELEARLGETLKQLPPWPGGSVEVRPKEKGRQLRLACACGRILRGAGGTIEKGPILCGLCGKEFLLEKGGAR